MIVVVVLGLTIRLAVAMMFVGSWDVVSQVYHGELIVAGESAWTSKLPVAYFLPAAMHLLADATQLPKTFTQKLPAIAGDLWIALLLYGIAARLPRAGPRWLWPAIYLLNPVTVMLSAYHGNADPLMGAAMLTALVLRWRERPLASGVMLGLAIAMKPTALLALPVLLLPLARRGNVRLAAAAVLTPVAICTPFALLDPTFGKFLSNYSGPYGNWGISLILRQVENVSRQLLGIDGPLVAILGALNAAFLASGRWILMGILVLWGLWMMRRLRIGDFEQNAIAMTATFFVFYVFTPGFGVQYLSLALPFLLIVSPRLMLWLSAVISPYILGTYLQAGLYERYGMDKPITARLASLSSAELTLLVATGLFAIASWLTCVWILYRLARPATAPRNGGVPPAEQAASAPLHSGGPGSPMLPTQTARRRHSG
jgi:hypothetical protein